MIEIEPNMLDQEYVILNPSKDAPYYSVRMLTVSGNDPVWGNYGTYSLALIAVKLDARERGVTPKIVDLPATVGFNPDRDTMTLSATHRRTIQCALRLLATATDIVRGDSFISVEVDDAIEAMDTIEAQENAYYNDQE